MHFKPAGIRITKTE